MRPGKKRRDREDQLPNIIENEEEKGYSVSSEYGMDTDRDTGDVNNAV